MPRGRFRLWLKTTGKGLCGGEMVSEALGGMKLQEREPTGGSPSSGEFMSEGSDKGISFVVLENGAAWPRWIADFQRIAPNSVIVAQRENEAPAAFELRVRRRLMELGSRRGDIVFGLISTNASLEREAVAARTAIAKAVLRSMPPDFHSKLVLGGCADASTAHAAARHELFALAGSLYQELSGTERSISVRFDEAAVEQSGVVTRSMLAKGPGAEPLQGAG